MGRYSRARLSPFSVLFLASALVAAYAVAHAAAAPSNWGADYFPNVVLTTQDGRPVHFYDDLLKGKIVAIDLIYTTCKYNCPLETARLAQVQKLLGDRMGRDVFFYSITIDPDHDTPAVLKQYAEQFHAGPGWLFLTGKASDIELISRKLGIYTEPDPANKDGHTPSLVVGNEATGQWMRNNALDNPQFLARTIGDWMNSWQTPRPGRSYADARPLAIDPGQYAFTAHCAPCHSVGGGTKVGPDLAGVTSVRDRDWLTRFIVDPVRMVADHDATAVALFEKYKPLQMPTLALTAADATLIIDYLDKAKPSGGPSASQPESGAARRVAEGSAPVNVDVTPMVAPYLRIAEALSADRIAGVTDAAGAIAALVPRVDSPAEFVLAPALALQRSADVASARVAFGKLSTALLTLARQNKAALPDGVKVAYCPMARKYWMQVGEEIRNPYYGKAMLECGRFVAGIPDLTTMHE